MKKGLLGVNVNLKKSTRRVLMVLGVLGWLVVVTVLLGWNSERAQVAAGVLSISSVALFLVWAIAVTVRRLIKRFSTNG